MKTIRLAKWMKLLLVGGVMFQIGGCLGPNPAFFVSTSAANATIMNIVSALFNSLILGG